MTKNKRIMNFPIVFNIFGMFGFGIFFLAIIKIRFLDHKSVSFLQQIWDSIAGTHGILFNLITFLAGAGIFAGLWLFMVFCLLVRKKRPALQDAVSHVTNNLKPVGLLGASGFAILLGGRLSFPYGGSLAFQLYAYRYNRIKDLQLSSYTCFHEYELGRAL